MIADEKKETTARTKEGERGRREREKRGENGGCRCHAVVSRADHRSGRGEEGEETVLVLKEIYVDACESVRVFFVPFCPSWVMRGGESKGRKKGDGSSRSWWTPGAVGRSVTGRGGLGRERGGRRRHVYSLSHISLVLRQPSSCVLSGRRMLTGHPQRGMGRACRCHLDLSSAKAIAPLCFFTA